MRSQRIIFFLVISAVMFGFYSYISNRLFDGAGLAPAALTGAKTLIAFLFLVQWFLPAVLWNRTQSLPAALKNFLYWTAYLSMGYFSFLLFILVVRDLAWLGLAGAFALKWIPSDGRDLLYSGPAALTLAGTALVFFTFGLFGALLTPPVKKVNIPVRDLPEGLNGFKIVQLTDLHVGPSIQSGFLEKVVRRANGLEPDLTVVTGDLIDGTVEQLKEEVKPLAELSAKLGKYYVTGNHEYYWGAEDWIAKVRELGLTPLLNSHENVQRDGAVLTVAGVLDLTAAHFGPKTPCDPKAAFQGAPEKSFRLLLAHQPKSAFGAEGLFDLQISGHTHGGQFLPWTLIVGLFQPMSRGLYRVKDAWIYVSKGTGFWGPPFRLGASSEITLLTLRKAL
jgi:predicted MPP superfamily phosphohydrolase